MPPFEPVHDAPATGEARPLLSRIGDFLQAHRLEPTPRNYALAYAVVALPDSALAVEVARRTDGGFRLGRQDVDDLGAQIGGEAVASDDDARFHAQVDGFADVVGAMHDHTRDFGRDLIASADAIQRSLDVTPGAGVAFDDVMRITSLMIDRVQEAELRLADARREADELRQALEEARGDARSDPLTGLPNRRAFEDAYAQRIATGATTCIAVCDVDHFKDVNDKFGHAVGDRVLRAIGVSLSTACKGHVVARFGGEEFAIMFASALDESAATLETARRNIARKRFRIREDDTMVGTITFSAGISMASAAEDLATVFERADSLLYAAKRAGRDRVFADGNIGD